MANAHLVQRETALSSRVTVTVLALGGQTPVICNVLRHSDKWQQETQLMLTNPRDAFTDQSRSLEPTSP